MNVAENGAPVAGYSASAAEQGACACAIEHGVSAAECNADAAAASERAKRKSHINLLFYICRITTSQKKVVN